MLNYLQKVQNNLTQIYDFLYMAFGDEYMLNAENIEETKKIQFFYYRVKYFESFVEQSQTDLIRTKDFEIAQKIPNSPIFEIAKYLKTLQDKISCLAFNIQQYTGVAFPIGTIFKKSNIYFSKQDEKYSYFGAYSFNDSPSLPPVAFSPEHMDTDHDFIGALNFIYEFIGNSESFCTQIYNLRQSLDIVIETFGRIGSNQTSHNNKQKKMSKNDKEFKVGKLLRSNPNYSSIELSKLTGIGDDNIRTLSAWKNRSTFSNLAPHRGYITRDENGRLDTEAIAD